MQPKLMWKFGRRSGYCKYLRFIGDAKEESVNTILEQVERKKEGKIGQLYVIGCLSQRYRDELKVEIPEVDGFFGKFDWPEVLKKMGRHFDRIKRTVHGTICLIVDTTWGSSKG